jgi:streptogramin lyase
LYRSGRQADALRAYRETRDTLVESLGIEPSTALQRLEHGILNHDPSLEAPAGVARSEPDRGEEIRPTEVATAAFETEPSGSRRLIPLLVVLLIAAGSVAAFAVWRHPKSSAATSSAPPHSLVAIDPRTNSSTRIAMDWAPSALGLSDGAVWALDGADQVVARVDPRARRVEQVIGLGVTPTDVSVGAGSVWMLSDRGVVVQLDPALGIVRSSTKVPTGSAPEGGVDYATQIAADAHAIWIEDGRALWRIDPANRAVTRRLLVGGGIGGVALGAGSVWVLRREPAALLHINSRTGAVRATIPIAQRRGSTEPVPIGLAVGEGAVWVLDGNTGTVTRVDPDVDAVVATSRRVSMNPTGIAVGAGAVWVADGAANALVRLDPTTDRIAGSIPLGGLPKALVAGRSRVWVAVDV